MLMLSVNMKGISMHPISQSVVNFELAWCLFLVSFTAGNEKSETSATFEEQVESVDAWIQRGSPWKVDLKKDVPLILWWTGRLFTGFDDVKEVNCGDEAVCYSSANRSYGAVARAFYFYGTDLDPEDLPLPRLPHHEWALIHEESPMNNYILSHGPMIRQFNHTATFKRESDYPITTHSLPSLEYLLSRRPLSLERKNELRRAGLAPVLYVQSHCGIPSDRDRYVKELMKHVPVDSYGKCLNNRELPELMRDPVQSMFAEDFLQFIAQYKFHIAFENAICPDYVTEKLFRPLHVGSVPIYRGSSRVKDWLPDEHLGIVADNFDSPQELAKFINFLDANNSEYERYLEFKELGVSNKFLLENMQSREWGINDHEKPNMFSGFECHICKKISKRHRLEKEHTTDSSVELLPRYHATVSHMSCPQPYTSLGDPSDCEATDK